jgi:hypothetical protein
MATTTRAGGAPEVALRPGSRRKQVTLFKFGVGREAVAIFPPAAQPAYVKTLAFDRIPSNISWMPTYEAALKILASLPRGDHARLLEASKHIREMVAVNVSSGISERTQSGRMQFDHDKSWEIQMKIMLACWRALEISLLEKRVPPRILMVRFGGIRLQTVEDKI